MLLINLNKQQTKRCTKCGETKPANTEYFSRRGNSGALDSWCKECRKAHKQKYRGRYDDREYNKNRPYKPLSTKDLPQNTEKTCTKCGETKPANLKTFPQRTNTTYESWCRECRRRYKREYDKLRRGD